MDTSKEYILMCEKAIEVQENHIYFSGDFLIINGSLDVSPVSHYPNITKCKDMVWLPRQDQLQDMCMEGFKHIYRLFDVFNLWMSDVDRYKYNSLEQLWLAHYMDHHHDKTWSGKEWINE